MFERRVVHSRGGAALGMVELIYHSIVREVRKTNSNALVGLMMSMLQTVIFVAVFYVMFSVLGLRGLAVRGDFLLFLLSGIFLFLTHTKTVGAVAGSEGPASAMMKHAPMNTIVAVCGAALSTLYLQLLSMFVILFIYSVLLTPVVIEEPIMAFACVLLAWITGVGVGIVLLAMKPWFPGFVAIVTMLYQRANMIASGKMFLANTLPPQMLAMFDWNPLFHAIDQARGFTFINYNPRVTDIMYPVYVTLVLTMIGLMGEFYTRKHASQSWGVS